ncbi:MAG: tripartite tricarboxylate transporter substrate binding protein [Burkholderiales bacterium]|jgi:tripartite-type tricarboxylate transporter receptor subunit TctC|nr:tripartite tricarboxylate transporter substrate binding protein [Burkholderiales bacterium]MDP4909546.1 tripartite tricarboxylate transporter substrate binding protein [Burkholderiaceae bacterium]MDP4969130.1 tripartite tricarboxylate transporter substrate binding protein [Burkholderiaceae bacterium]
MNKTFISMLKQLLCFFCVIAGNHALAAFPEKPVTLVVPFAPGGSNDIVARQLAKQLTAQWGQPVIIENKPGAGTAIGAAYVAKQRNDGYTLLIASSTFTMAPSVNKKLPFNPAKDFTPIAMIGEVPLVLAAKPNAPGKDAKEYFEYLKRTPNLNYGATGVGSIQHFAGVMLSQALGNKMVAIQYKGGGPAMTDTMGGHIEFSIGSMTQILPQLRNGTLRGIAVTSTQRSEAAPNLPTFQEAGLKNYEIQQWWGLLGPANVPSDIQTFINRSVNQALKSEELIKFLATDGGKTKPMSVADFTTLVNDGLKRWDEVAKQTGITAQ